MEDLLEAFKADLGAVIREITSGVSRLQEARQPSYLSRCGVC